MIEYRLVYEEYCRDLATGEMDWRMSHSYNQTLAGFLIVAETLKRFESVDRIRNIRIEKQIQITPCSEWERVPE